MRNRPKTERGEVREWRNFPARRLLHRYKRVGPTEEIHEVTKTKLDDEFAMVDAR